MSQLTREQQMAVDNRGGTLLVSAAAGSGKTRVLVERLFAYITGSEKRDLDEFLIITYTRAAADELRAKIMSELSLRLKKEPGNAHLQKQSMLIYRTQISTIHTFCGELIRDQAHLLGLSPDFRIMDEDEASLLLESALDELMERRYHEPDEDFLQLVDMLGAGRDDKKLCNVVIETYRKLRSHPEPEVWGKECLEKLGNTSTDSKNCWYSQILRDVADTAGYWAKRLADAGEEMKGYPDMYASYGECFSANAATLSELSNLAAEEKWDEVRGKLPVNFGKLGSLRNFEYPQLQERMKSVRELAKKSIAEFEKVVDCSYMQACEDTSASIPAVRGLIRLVRELDMDFTQLKLSRSAADFGDLEHYAVKLLCPAGVQTELADIVASRYREVMVDEYQDTNVIQNLIFSAVSGGRLFSVGDVKQSIYRFNLADPTIFLRKYTSYLPVEKAEEGQPRKIILSDNFRSRPEITNCVNFVFKNIMSTKFGEMDYGEAEMLRSTGTFPQVGNMPAELDIVDTGAMDEDDEFSRSEIEAEYVAVRVKKLLDSRMLITGQDGKARQICAGDIVILMRSPAGKTNDYVRALEERGIAVSTQSPGFFKEQEIATMISLLEIIDNPHQDIPLIAVLRSPLFGFSDDKLARVRACDKNCDFFDALVKFSKQDKTAEMFLYELRQMRMRSRELGAEELIWLCFEKLSILQVFGALPNGEKRKKNLILFAEQANGFEKRGYRGLFDFVLWLRKLRDTDREPSVGISATSDAVRIMSIHKSKGLEFAVVVLADLGKRFNFKDLDRQVLIHTELGIGTKCIDSQRMLQYSTVARNAIRRRLKAELMAEELRLLYVAMTRAKDKLIMIAAVENVEREMKKLAVHACSPVAPESMQGLNCMAKWLMLTSLLEGANEALKVNYITQADKDCIDQEPNVKVEFKPAASDELVTLAKTNLDYVYPHAAAINTPSKITATALKGRQIDEEIASGAEKIFTKPRHINKPRFIEETKKLSGSEKGIALHLAMQYICYSKCVTVQGIKEELERLQSEEYMTQAQIEAVDPQRIYKLFSSPLGAKLLQADKVQREFKFSLLMSARELKLGQTEDKVLVQGVIDCFIDTPEGLIVVDFKSDLVTNANVYERAQGYKIQIDTYCTALERITGKQIARRVLYFFALDMEIDL